MQISLLLDLSPPLLPQPVQRTVRITLSTDESGESKCGELAIVQSILIHVPNVDLD